jgi:hypothetical protein
MIRKISSTLMLLVATVLLCYVGWANYEVGLMLDQGAEILEPSKFFTEQFMLLAVGLVSGMGGLLSK